MFECEHGWSIENVEPCGMCQEKDKKEVIKKILAYAATLDWSVSPSEKEVIAKLQKEKDELEKKFNEMKEIFHVNMMRIYPHMSHEDIDRELNRKYNDNWITWDPDKHAPIDPKYMSPKAMPASTKIDVKTRKGKVYANVAAGWCDWEHRNDTQDIVAYRYVE